MQKGHPITFENKKFSRAQLKWPTHEKELFVVMNYLKTWQHYMGLKKIKIFMDNVCVLDISKCNQGPLQNNCVGMMHWFLWT
jgi:hypothetical protein